MRSYGILVLSGLSCVQVVDKYSNARRCRHIYMCPLMVNQANNHSLYILAKTQVYHAKKHNRLKGQVKSTSCYTTLHLLSCFGLGALLGGAHLVVSHLSLRRSVKP